MNFEDGVRDHISRQNFWARDFGNDPQIFTQRSRTSSHPKLHGEFNGTNENPRGTTFRPKTSMSKIMKFTFARIWPKLCGNRFFDAARKMQQQKIKNNLTVKRSVLEIASFKLLEHLLRRVDTLSLSFQTNLRSNLINTSWEHDIRNTDVNIFPKST